MKTVELRCEEHPSRMFAKLLVEEPLRVVSGNLIEFKCRDCGKRRNADVLHRFNALGELVETVVASQQSQSERR